jgi:hypothetical protein
MRHDILEGILRQAIHRTEVASTLELTLHQLPGLEAAPPNSAPGTVATCLEAWGVILLALESGILVVDVSITIMHPTGVASPALAALTVGTAAAWWDREERWTYDRLELHRYPFISFSTETYGWLGKPTISLFGQLFVKAEETGLTVSKSGFVAAAIRELNIRLCRGNFQMCRTSLVLLVSVTGRGFLAGGARPAAKVLWRDSLCLCWSSCA